MPSRPGAPLISVVVPFHNDERFIESCLQSVLSQAGVEVEVVAVDDRGTDQTSELVHDAMKSDARIRCVEHSENRGLAAARNSGIEYARGEMIAFLDADDFYFPGVLRHSSRLLAKKSTPLSRIAGAYCGWEMVPEETTPSYVPVAEAKNRRLSYLQSRGENPLIVTAPILWRDTVIDVGGFDETFPTAEDFDFWMRLLRQGYVIVPTGRVGVAYRQKRSGMISDGLATHASHAKRIYDYIHRPLRPGEVSAGAPAPIRRSFADHDRAMQWVRRIVQFVVLAEGGGNEAEVDALLSMLPPDLSLADLDIAALRKSVEKSLVRHELRNRPLSQVEKTELSQTVLDRLIVHVGLQSKDRSAEPNIEFQHDIVRARSIEVGNSRV